MFYVLVSHCICVYHLFTHSSVDGHLGCFHVLAILSSAAVNIAVHVSFQIMVFSGYMPRSGTDGSYDNSIFRLRAVHTILGYPGGSVVKSLPTKQETQVWSLGREDSLEKEMATHSSILAWKISWIEEPEVTKESGMT